MARKELWPGRFNIGGRVFNAPGLEPALYAVSTPIGNLGDITLRALDVLAGADLIVAEDTRVAFRLMQEYGIATRVERFDAHSSAERIADLARRVLDGRPVALISDAGTPMISDPGADLARAVRAAGGRVIAVPGASAVLAALVSADLPADRFFFEGFLPQKSGPRLRRLRELENIPGTLVIFEAPHRIHETLEDAGTVFPGRRFAVARELTKRFETLYSGTAVEIGGALALMPEVKGEIVLLIGPPGAKAAPALDLDAKLKEAMLELSVKDAASVVAAAAGLPRREVYARAIVLDAEAKRAKA